MTTWREAGVTRGGVLEAQMFGSSGVALVCAKGALVPCSSTRRCTTSVRVEQVRGEELRGILHEDVTLEINLGWNGSLARAASGIPGRHTRRITSCIGTVS